MSAIYQTLGPLASSNPSGSANPNKPILGVEIAYEFSYYP